MSFNAGSVIVKFLADTASFKKGIDEAKSSGVSAGDSIAGGFIKAQIALGVLQKGLEFVQSGFAKLTEFLGSASDAAKEQEKALTGLGIYYKNVLKKDSAEATQRAEELGKALKIGVGPAAESLQRLLKSGLNLEQATELMRRFTNEALTGKNSSITLGEAVLNLSQMYQTELSALGDRAGISENFLNILEKQAALERVNINELTDAQREQLKYRAYISLTNETLGSADAFLGTLIDSQSIYSGQLEEIRVRIGNKLNPVINTFYKSILIPMATFILEKVVPIIEKFGDVIFPVVENIANLVQGIMFAIDEGDAWNDLIWESMKALGFSEDQIRSFMGWLQNFIDNTLPQFIENAKKFFNDLKDRILELWNNVKPVLQSFADFLINNWKPIVAGVLFAMAIGFTLLAIKAVAAAIATIAAWLPVILIIGALILIGALLYKAWTSNFLGIQDKVKAVVDFVKNTLWPILQQVFNQVGQIISELVQNVIIPAIQRFINIMQRIGEILGWLWTNIISPIFNFIGTLIGNIIQNIIIPAIQRFISIVQGIAEVLGWVWNNIVSPILQLIGAIFSRIFYEIAKVVIDRFNQIRSFIELAMQFIRDKIITPLSDAYNNHVRPIIEGILNFIKDKFNQAVDFLNGLKDKVLGAIVGPFEDAKKKVEDIANGIKEAANRINPFHKQSPSLVENVQNGIRKIIDSYSDLKSLTFPSVAHIPNLAMAGQGDFSSMSSIADVGGGVNSDNIDSQGSGDTYNFNVKGEVIDDVAMTNFTEKMLSEMEKIKKSKG